MKIVLAAAMSILACSQAAYCEESYELGRLTSVVANLYGSLEACKEKISFEIRGESGGNSNVAAALNFMNIEWKRLKELDPNDPERVAARAVFNDTKSDFAKEDAISLKFKCGSLIPLVTGIGIGLGID